MLLDVLPELEWLPEIVPLEVKEALLDALREFVFETVEVSELLSVVPIVEALRMRLLTGSAIYTTLCSESTAMPPGENMIAFGTSI